MISKRSILYYAIAIILILAIAVFYVFRPSPETVGRGKADFEISATQLVAAFEENESGANQQFVDKVLQVEGQITDISKESENTVIIYLDGESMGNVSCAFSEDGLQNVQPEIGELVQVKGLCKGYIMDVVLQKCKLLNQK